MINKVSILILLFFMTLSIKSQKGTDYFEKKGKWFLSWGYNRSAYDPSTIHFKGKGYDFTLNNVPAADRPSPFDPKVYFSITKLSIPQFNVRTGYFINENWAITLGYDHMKYVMPEGKSIFIKGSIDSSTSAKYAGEYDNYMVINRDFLGFEHTDGLNFLTTDIEYHTGFYRSKREKIAIDFFIGGGIGITIPKTNANLFNSIGKDAFHLAGGGLSFNFGPRLYLWKHFYAHGVIKRGILFMPNIATNVPESDKASQIIKFWEGYFQFGWLFKI